MAGRNNRMAPLRGRTRTRAGGTPHTLGAAILCASSAFMSAGPARAQAPDAAAPSADAQGVRSYDLAPGPLAVVLNRFAQAAGVSLAFHGAALDGLQSPGIRGRYSVEAGFRQILRDSGFEAIATGPGRYGLRALPAGQAQTLSAVTVLGTASERTEGSASYAAGTTRAATGMALTPRETPQSVSVITRQRMDDQGLDSVEKALEQAPGIFFYSTGPAVSGNNSAAFARGHQVDSFQIDGVTVPSGAWSTGGSVGTAALDTALYDSVAIVRGATGLLSGAGDPGASISLTRKRPTDQFQASAAQSLGRWDQRRSVADLGGPLSAAGTLRGRLVAVYDEGGSWVDRYRGYKSLIYGVLDADLGPDTTLSLAVEHARETAGGTGPEYGFDAAFSDGTPTPFSRNDNAQADWSHWHNQRTMFSAALEHRFNQDWQARVFYGRTHSDMDFKFGKAGMYSGIEPDGSAGMTLRSNQRKNRVDVFDVRLDGSYTLWSRRHELVAGFNASDADLRTPRSLTIRNAGTVSVLDWDGSAFPEPDWSDYAFDSVTMRTRQSGAWLATRLRATDALSLIAGARWSNWKTRAQLNGEVYDDRKERDVLTPYFGVTYDLPGGLTAYASHTEIFNPQSDKDASGRVLDPEEGTNTELGLKGEWFGGQLTASAAVFRIGKDNLAVEDGDRLTPEGDQAYVGADDTKGRGWEVEVAGELAPGWQVQAAYTRMVLRDSDGVRLETDRQPKHQFKLFTTWTPARMHRLTVGGGVLWQSELHDSWDPALRDAYTQKSYAVVNLMARYAFDRHLSLALHLNNVLDKSYRTVVWGHTYGAPRNLYATLKYQF